MSGLLICSDIHGDAVSAEKVLDAFKRHGADRLVILGDILYHGPRNDQHTCGKRKLRGRGRSDGA